MLHIHSIFEVLPHKIYEIWVISSHKCSHNIFLITIFSGDGIHSVPIHRMCIISMAMSDEAIINYLLSETMRVERKEFEGQKRSNENDIILHRQRLAREHVCSF